jgi:patatin-like phospholipase/acyl hydrolase
MGLIRILSLDGGGVRGIIPSEILITLEELFKKHSGRKSARIADYFDLIAGTSSGGILTAMYLCPDKSNGVRPKFSAKEASSIFEENCSIAFSKKMLHGFTSVFGLTRPRYSAKNIEKCFNYYLGDIKLSELLKPCVITAYDVKNCKAVLFNQMSARKDKSRDFLIRDVVRATSSVPVYFPVANIKSLNGTYYDLADGGIFANNPALCAYAESAKLKGGVDAKNVIILSIGTGRDKPHYVKGKINNWGAIKWAIPLFEALISGVSQTVDYQLRIIFDSINKSYNYLRIQPNLNTKILNGYKLDDVSQATIKKLKQIGSDTVNDYFKELDNFAKVLVSQSVNNFRIC